MSFLKESLLASRWWIQDRCFLHLWLHAQLVRTVLSPIYWAAVSNWLLRKMDVTWFVLRLIYLQGPFIEDLSINRLPMERTPARFQHQSLWSASGSRFVTCSSFKLAVWRDWSRWSFHTLASRGSTNQHRNCTLWPWWFQAPGTLVFRRMYLFTHLYLQDQAWRGQNLLAWDGPLSRAIRSQVWDLGKLFRARANAQVQGWSLQRKISPDLHWI